MWSRPDIVLTRPRVLKRPIAPRGAFTLIELMVVVVISVVALGLVLGILIDTRKAVVSGQETLALRNEARMVADLIQRVLEASIRPSYLDGPSTATQLVFKADQCVVLSSHLFDGKDLHVWTIGNEAARDDRAGSVLCKPVSIATQRPMANFDIHPGLDSQKISTSVSFSYATQTSPSGMENFRNELGAGEYPVLIRAKVRAMDLGDAKKPGRPESFEVIFSVPMPGL
jgi:prepilin-type N-terminal cleavage/methylation domain-containing protein